MTQDRRPLPVTIVAWVYIAVGTIGFVYHLTEFQSRGAFRYDGVWVELVRLMAIVCGVFMFRGHNWARWLAVAWIGFHVILSAFHTRQELAVHCVFFAVIAWCLFRPGAGRYFGGSRTEPSSAS